MFQTNVLEHLSLANSNILSYVTLYCKVLPGDKHSNSFVRSVTLVAMDCQVTSPYTYFCRASVTKTKVFPNIDNSSQHYKTFFH
jgi:hypothetical protein